MKPLVWRFHQLQLLLMAALDHLYDVQSWPVAATQLYALISRKVVEYFHHSSAHIHHPQLHFLSAIAAVDLHGKLRCAWVRIGAQGKHRCCRQCCAADSLHLVLLGVVIVNDDGTTTQTCCWQTII